nr:hypothetical protein [Helicoverpa armigera nucleopolyhedrovirus]
MSFVFLGHESKQKITARFKQKDPRQFKYAREFLVDDVICFFLNHE